MITIEEKLKLFTKIVYDKVERENQAVAMEFDKEFGNIIDKKRKEYNEEAESILRDNQREIQREKTRLLSKAKIEEKKILRDMEKRIFDKVNEELLKHAIMYRSTQDYEEKFMRDIASVNSQLSSDEIELFCCMEDLQRYKGIFENLFKNKRVNYVAEDELVGGFVLKETLQGVRYDMSILGKIMASRETIGNILFKSLQ